MVNYLLFLDKINYMKKILIFSLLAAIFTFGFSTDIQAQSRGKKKKSSKTDEYFDDSGNWTQKLWYGAGGTLGFSGGQGASLFQIGISPMVGYKLTPWLSAGPRLSVVYTGLKGGAVNVEERDGQLIPIGGTEDNSANKIGATDFGAGLFARAKFLQSFFVHAELESYTSSRPVSNNSFNFWRYDDTLEFVKVKENRLNTYIGAGYNSSGGGLLGYEIMLLYNLNVPESSFDSPLEIRAGLTYNF
ncbi:MAG: hypothetical protein ACI85O_000383 [Saprospiraceae bacterium]